MNILMIGNGFDLAHGLPTSYPDFLGFCRMIMAVYAKDKNGNADRIWAELGIKLKNNTNTDRLQMKFSELYSVCVVEKDKQKGNIIRTHTVYDELFDDIENNTWIEYFLQNTMYQKENWIDFESEISTVIRSVENNMQGDIEGYVTNLDNCFLSKKYVDSTLDFGDGKIQYKKFSELRDILLKDLNRLIRAFEIYLYDYVYNLKIEKSSPDISGLEINYLLSFNYTNTYMKLYNLKKMVNILEEPFDFIHGIVDINNSIETNRMVLGIDEYLSKKKRNEKIEFIAFKKYYQRIYKATGYRYKDWIDKIKESGQNAEQLRKQYPVQIPFEKFTKKHYLFIFGHSLDITDRDILRDLILNDNVYTTIYYPDKKELGKKIANLVKVIGQDELIRRTGGNTKTIEFKLQAEMVKRKGELDL